MFLRKSSSERHAEAVFSQYDLNSSQVPSQLSALQPSAQYQPETCKSLNGNEFNYEMLLILHISNEMSYQI